MKRLWFSLVIMGSTFCLWGQNFDQVVIKTEKITDSIYMLVGAGGNIGVSAGEDGVFLIDDQFAPLSEKIKTAVTAISEKPIRFVVNTHWHFDHTGGNESMGEVGAVIVAHHHVRERMSKKGFIEALNIRTEPSPAIALPVITFTEDLTFHLNGDEIYVFHPAPNAHTDGDAIIWFKKADVVHMGDIYFSGMYPFIDTSSGGTIHGVIDVVDKVLGMIGDDTKLIPGHGPLSTKADLQVYRAMLAGVRDQVGKLVKEGKSVEEALAAKPTAAYDETWGKGFLNPELFTRIVYQDLSRDQ